MAHVEHSNLRQGTRLTKDRANVITGQQMKLLKSLAAVLRLDRLQAQKEVRDFFLSQHPTEKYVHTRMRADEPDRFVIGVFYGDTRPPRYQFYAVSKQSFLVQKIEDTSPYRPKIWR